MYKRQPYTREQHDISFSLPNQKCVGTFTVWIENNGEKIAKNFVNVIVTNGKDTAPVSILTEDSAVLRQSNADSNTIKDGVGAITYSYTCLLYTSGQRCGRSRHGRNRPGWGSVGSA